MATERLLKSREKDKRALKSIFIWVCVLAVFLLLAMAILIKNTDIEEKETQTPDESQVFNESNTESEGGGDIFPGVPIPSVITIIILIISYLLFKLFLGYNRRRRWDF